MTRASSAATRLVHAALAVVLAGNVVALLFYEFVTYRLSFHSDAAVKNIFAEQVFRTGSPFPTDWAYVNGDVMVFFGHLFILPLLPFFANGFALHAVSGTVMSALLLFTIDWFMRRLRVSLAIRLLALCLFASGISSYFAENLFGQVSYGPVVILLLLHLGMAIVATRGTTRAAGRSTSIAPRLALALLALVAFTGNPERALVTYVLPMIVLTLSVALSPNWLDAMRWRRWAAGTALPLGSYAAGALAGIALHAAILSHSVAVAAGGKRSLMALESLPDRASLLASSVLFLFGADGPANHSVVSPWGVSLFLHVVLVAAVVITLARGWPVREGDPYPPALVTAAALSLVVTTFLFLFTNLAEDRSSSRYLLPALTLGLLALLVLLDRRLAREGAGMWLVAALAAIAGVAVVSQPVALAQAYRSLPPAERRLALPRNASEDLLAFLERNGLRRGYASYWHAHVNTVLSGGRVVIRPVIYSGAPRAMYQLSAPSWYGLSNDREPVFFLVADAEARNFDPHAIEDAAGTPEKVLTFPGYTVYVYPGLQRGWVGWDPAVRFPATMRYSSHTPHTTGRFVEEGAPAGRMQADAGQAGALVFGPYIALLKGRYTADFELARCDAASANAGEVDVTALQDGQAMLLARAPIPDGRQWVTQSLPFDLSANTDGIEMRVMTSGAGCVSARSVRLSRRP